MPAKAGIQRGCGGGIPLTRTEQSLHSARQPCACHHGQDLHLVSQRHSNWASGILRSRGSVQASIPLAQYSAVCASTYCLSLFLSSLVTRQPRVRSLVGSIPSFVTTAFCDVSVPLGFWPDSVQLIVQFLPVTHGLQAIRMVLDEAAVGLGWLVVATITLDRMANAGRADGSIEFV